MLVSALARHLPRRVIFIQFNIWTTYVTLTGISGEKSKLINLKQFKIISKVRQHRKYWILNWSCYITTIIRKQPSLTANGTQSLRYLAQNPFFLAESFSERDRFHLDPSEKCLLRKGFPNELLVLELGSIFETFPPHSISFWRSKTSKPPSR